MDNAVYRRRTRACQRRLAESDADAVVLFPGSNLTYLTGFADDPGERHLLLFVTADDSVLLVPELYADQLRAETHLDDLRVWRDGDDPREAVRETVAALGLGDAERVLVDERMWARFTRDLRAVMPDATLDLADEVLGELRARKDDAELDRLRRVATATDAVSEALRESDPVGDTERDLAREIERHLRDEGCTESSFETIVGSGPNGAHPHHTHGDRTIERGDPVVLDFGGRIDGYPSDQTRTVVWGDPPEGFEEVHRVVSEAQQAAVETVEPGVPASAVDRAARDVIEDAGYGDRFLHRTGHGVGLDVHEPPYITGENDRRLEERMVFSVEPGVYVEGEFGVRIEDLVVVTADGHERLNDSSRDWRV